MVLLVTFQTQPIWKIILDAYIIWIAILFIFKLIIANKRILHLTLLFFIFIILGYVVDYLGLIATEPLLRYIINWYPVFVVVIMAPDIRRSLEIVWKKETGSSSVIMGSQTTRDAIVDATMYLSKEKIGAIITIEKHNTLDHFAERAIMMHSNISKELLINIFTPNTPLHDGAVIVRGDQILCAAAYYILSDKAVQDKTMGSRHRAGLGISEVTDSLTIIISEETGDVSIAVEGILLKMNDKDKLMEYISMFMR
ncbi:MAG TPA: TIGR00159 family protein [Acholeplasmataceae bacterium]|nr:TIGR00159 family protein [Acholeplasmataceae bacterium]